MNRKIGCIIGGVVITVVATAVVAFFYVSRNARRLGETRSTTGVPGSINVQLPIDLKNAEQDTAVSGPTAVVVSLRTDDEFYVGSELTLKDALGYKVGAALKGQTGSVKTVYLAVGDRVDYGAVVEALARLRRQSVDRIGLIVDNQRRGSVVPNVFMIKVPPEPDPNEGPRKEVPPPFTLILSIARDLKLNLNGHLKPLPTEPCFGVIPDFGSTEDPGHAVQCLTQIFQRRKEQPEAASREERTVIVKAPRTVRYGIVVTLVDALKGAGAIPIVLQIDDLSD